MISASQAKAAVNSPSGRRMRTLHRWVSLLFTAAVSANFGVMVFGTPPSWVTYSTLPPIFLLLGTGLHMLGKYYLPRRKQRGR